MRVRTRRPARRHRRRRQRRGGAARLRPLRHVQRGLPDLPAHRRRARWAARPHLPDEGRAGGRAGRALRPGCTSTAAWNAGPARPPARPASSTTACWTSAATVRRGQGRPAVAAAPARGADPLGERRARRVRRGAAAGAAFAWALPAGLKRKLPKAPLGPRAAPAEARRAAGARSGGWRCWPAACRRPPRRTSTPPPSGCSARSAWRSPRARGAGCCGAVSFHLDAPDEARALARRNIDAWTAELDAGAGGRRRHRQRLRGVHQGLSRPAGRRPRLCREGAADRRRWCATRSRCWTPRR